jgi:hypothetical protein
MLRRVDLPTLRAAFWAERTLRQARRALRRGRLEDIRLPDPPALPPESERGVRAVLRRTPATCLERALVLQRWHAARGNPREVVIGVKGPTDEFAAHAWLDGEPDSQAGVFEELFRLRVT